MFRSPLLTDEELGEYRLTLIAMSDADLGAEATAEIRKGFYDEVFAVNDQKARACHDEFQSRGKLYLYQRAYNSARTSVGLKVTAQELADAAAPDAIGAPAGDTTGNDSADAA